MIWEALLPALISGGSSLLGGLFSPKTDNRGHNKAVSQSNQKRIKAANLQEIRWNRKVEAKAKNSGSFMMAEAEKLGINPITYLQAGGLSHAYDVATVGLSKPAYSYYVRPEEGYTTSGMTTGEAIGGGLNAFGSSLASGLQQQFQNNFSREMLGLSLAAANNRGNGSGYSMGAVPTAALFGSGHMTSSAGQGGHATGGAGMETFYGPVRNPVPYDRDKGEEIWGPVVNDIMEPVIYGPEVLKQPENQDFLTKLGREWFTTAANAVNWAINPVSRVPGLYKRIPAGTTGPLVPLTGNHDDPIFNEGFW